MVPREFSDVLINLNIEKSDKAIQAAELLINNGLLESALNRIYYAIFYIVTALAEKNDFVTSKHSSLIGWFNKKFIYEEKVFKENIYKIYDKTYKFREKSDYDPLYHATIEDTNEILTEAKIFIETVRKEI